MRARGPGLLASARDPRGAEFEAQLEQDCAPAGPDERERLLDLLVDAAGAAVIGHRSQAARAVAEVLEVPAAVWDLACADGTAIHALDFDDTHEPSLCHTAAALVPAALGLAVARHRSGEEVLRAYVAGLRFVDFLAPLGPLLNEKGVHATGTLGALGAAVTSAVVLGGGPGAAARAVELAAVMAAGLCASFGTQAKPLQAGRAAEAGVRAALLTEAGLEPPSGALTGPRGLIPLLLGPDAVNLLPAPGPRRHAVHNVAVKAYPSCLLTHTPIDLALEARELLGITSADQIGEAVLTVHPLVAELAGTTCVRTGLDGKFSVLYCVLGAFAEGAPAVETFTATGRERLLASPERWRRFTERVRVVTDPGRPRLSATLSVSLTNGRRSLHTRTGQVGGVSRPLTSERIRQKFFANVTAPLGESAAAALLERVHRIPAARDVAEVGSVLRASPRLRRDDDAQE